MIWGARPPNAFPLLGACIVALETIVDIVSKVGLVGMVDIVGLVNKYSRHSQQDRHSLTWYNKTLTLLCLAERLVFHVVYISFAIK